MKTIIALNVIITGGKERPFLPRQLLASKTRKAGCHRLFDFWACKITHLLRDKHMPRFEKRVFLPAKPFEAKLFTPLFFFLLPLLRKIKSNGFFGKTTSRPLLPQPCGLVPNKS
ncbi:MAG: hypothetical protein PUB53_02745 [Bacteroidales bacterium]|nr:hypothetical protein [Bacteroidales bacterium]